MDALNEWRRKPSTASVVGVIEQIPYTSIRWNVFKLSAPCKSIVFVVGQE
jgi:hypothetical protein